MPSLTIAGAGIAGLSCAITLAQHGLQCPILESRVEPPREGAGIQLGPNAVFTLRALGIDSEFFHRCAQPQAISVFRLESGKKLCSLSLKDFVQRYHSPYLTCHRADLYKALLARAKSLGLEPLWGHPYVAPESSEAWIIRADGVGSQGQAPHKHAAVAIRGLISSAAGLAFDWPFEVQLWVAEGRHLVVYPTARTGELSAVLCVSRADLAEQPSGSHVDAELFSESLGPHAQALEPLIAAMDSWSSWPLLSSDPLRGPQTLFGERCVRIGDAAHPLKPHMAQGAALALEDGLVLGRLIGEGPRNEEGLGRAAARYAQARWQRVARIQRKAERLGEVFQQGGVVGAARDAALRLAGPAFINDAALFGWTG
ncbi:MAG: FAD-binding protein [Betaproteobacteria bacterium]|nr:FAD-binding protein [Betaproteobacteria bacterium]NBT76324.1 FAD-binding protein [Betaproteobacteria bacterium]NBY14090.1 FAD-binding protein [Betaproteobacteria bacterium]